ncbi:MAG: hypothetical protein IPO04_08395 [Cytophagaceae bacterium]|nr:hypothetical protein [Cytophagaceae bacterium]
MQMILHWEILPNYIKRNFGSKNKLTKIDVSKTTGQRPRYNINWFNFVFHNDKNSGAFMTWLHPEHEYGQWSVVKTAFNVLVDFCSWKFSLNFKAYKPWGAVWSQ